LKDRVYREVAGIELEHCQPIALLVFSEQEFNRLRERERRIARDILEEGVAPVMEGNLRDYRSLRQGMNCAIKPSDPLSPIFLAGTPRC
jgi:hypothetical protein